MQAIYNYLDGIDQSIARNFQFDYIICDLVLPDDIHLAADLAKAIRPAGSGCGLRGDNLYYRWRDLVLAGRARVWHFGSRGLSTLSTS